MSATAMEQIVSAYVRTKNRRALEELKMHRHRLAVDLRLRAKLIYNHSLAIGAMLEDLAAIEEGLSQLGPPAIVLAAVDLTDEQHKKEETASFGPVAITSTQLPILSMWNNSSKPAQRALSRAT